MSKKFPTLEQALKIDEAEKERFSLVKIKTLQELASLRETWAFKQFNKNNFEKYNLFIESWIDILTEYLTHIDDMPNLEFISNNISTILSEANKIERYFKEKFDNNKNLKISFNEFRNLSDLMGSGSTEFIKEFEKERNEKLENLKNQLETLYQSLLSFIKLKENFNDYLRIYINQSVNSVNKELEVFRRLRNLADNAKTEDIYNSAVDKYRDLEENYRSYFYWGIGIVLCLSVALLTLKQDLVPHLFSTIEFWAVKVSILLVGITLISYFLKQSAHYQRLADQNYQTQVELQAYPSFMESIPTEEAASVRKELALKYFGREIDGAAHKDMSNLISDQMKSTTDMVKATTEAIKNMKG
ncbi:hypothetical protein ACT4VW_12045 [Acinetobacter baumannii]